MSESAIADFVTSFIPDTATHAEPVRGRVVMSKRRIVLATEDAQRDHPLAGVFDVQHDTAPRDLAEFFEDTVTVAYERGGEKHVAVIEGAGDTVDKFVTLVFKGLLNGSAVYAKHPARRGGRVTERSFESGSCSSRPGLSGSVAMSAPASTSRRSRTSSVSNGTSTAPADSYSPSATWVEPAP